MVNLMKYHEVASINGLLPNESYAMTLHATLDGLTA